MKSVAIRGRHKQTAQNGVLIASALIGIKHLKNDFLNMNNKQFLILLGSVLLGIGILFFLFRNHQERWTGFYYPNVLERDAVSVIGSTPKYQSEVGEFLALEECKRWGYLVRQRLFSGKGHDLIYCTQKCSRKVFSNGLSCSFSSGMKFFVEEE